MNNIQRFTKLVPPAIRVEPSSNTPENKHIVSKKSAATRRIRNGSDDFKNKAKLAHQKSLNEVN